MQYTISKAEVSDFTDMHKMIIEFAHFQRTPEKATITVAQMEEDADFLKALIVKQDKIAIGYATYYIGYSCWSGRHLYLDDLYLEEEHRNQGLGHQIMDRLEFIAQEEKCKSMRWLVSKWNQNAIAFYKKRGASIDNTEFTCQVRID